MLIAGCAILFMLPLVVRNHLGYLMRKHKMPLEPQLTFLFQLRSWIQSKWIACYEIDQLHRQCKLLHNRDSLLHIAPGSSNTKSTIACFEILRIIQVSVAADCTLLPWVTLSKISPTMWKYSGSLPWFSIKSLTC